MAVPEDPAVSMDYYKIYFREGCPHCGRDFSWFRWSHSFVCHGCVRVFHDSTVTELLIIRLSEIHKLADIHWYPKDSREGNIPWNPS